MPDVVSILNNLHIAYAPKSQISMNSHEAWMSLLLVSVYKCSSAREDRIFCLFGLVVVPFVMLWNTEVSSKDSQDQTSSTNRIDYESDKGPSQTMLHGGGELEAFGLPTNRTEWKSRNWLGDSKAIYCQS